MLAHRGVAQLVAARAVELVESVAVLREVGGHPVEDHTDVCSVAGVDQHSKLLRRAVAVRRRVVTRHLIAPRRIVGIFHQRHEFDVRIAHVLHIGDQLRRQLLIAEVTAVVVPLPRAGVDLVDVDRALEACLLELVAAVGRVGPAELFRRIDHARRLGQRHGAIGIGVGLVDLVPVRTHDTVFIGAAALGKFRHGLPDAAAAETVHRKIFFVPEVEIAGHADGLCVRRPDAEDEAFVHGVTAEIPVGLGAAGAFELPQECGELFIHIVPPSYGAFS